VFSQRPSCRVRAKENPCAAGVDRDRTIGVGPRSEGGFGITAELDVYLPGLPEPEARKLVDTTHGICPYSNAIKASVDVKTITRS
jgi:organic hydroperoxide reductase OsmC/OhrA